MKLAVLFSGQGSQYPGMGNDFIKQLAFSKEYIKTLNEILQYDFIETLNDDHKVSQTLYTQPLMVGIEVIIHDYLKSIGLKVDGYAGFSLGEYTGLYASGVLDFETLIKLIGYRAKLMDEVSKKTSGKMAAVLGLEDKVVEAICKEVSDDEDFCILANYNSSNQIVISGSEKVVLKAIEKLKENGAKRTILLNVSGAFHSPYLRKEGQLLADYAKQFKLNDPCVDLYKNTDGKKLNDSIIEELKHQIFSPVYFKQTIENMVHDGYTHFLEIGPGQVLTGLVKKINPNLTTFNVSKIEDIETIKGVLI